MVNMPTWSTLKLSKTHLKPRPALRDLPCSEGQKLISKFFLFSVHEIQEIVLVLAMLHTAVLKNLVPLILCVKRLYFFRMRFPSVASRDFLYV